MPTKPISKIDRKDLCWTELVGWIGFHGSLIFFLDNHESLISPNYIVMILKSKMLKISIKWVSIKCFLPI